MSCTIFSLSVSGSSTAKHGTSEIVVVDNFLGEFLKAKVTCRYFLFTISLTLRSYILLMCLGEKEGG